jgi:hypothetical protein
MSEGGNRRARGERPDEPEAAAACAACWDAGHYLAYFSRLLITSGVPIDIWGLA